MESRIFIAPPDELRLQLGNAVGSPGGIAKAAKKLQFFGIDLGAVDVSSIEHEAGQRSAGSQCEGGDELVRGRVPLRHLR